MERINKGGTNVEEVADGVFLGDLAAGRRAGMKYWRVEPGATLPAHRHDHEQIGYMISGELVTVLEDEEVLLEPGDSYRFASNEYHGAENRGKEPAVGVGILAPPRGEPEWGDSGIEEPTAPR
ncbi:cupin domain-containing protein [Halalkalicoccus jeotgali]|uniref:Cupin 2 barrel domain-containing protein n=1 Tax=Halalkalicoccus jeotgali (strain DSM 18796 / CECT 7217 / JCM 14584 / KCTC 4019 / B3) TaxID=795797 RepID=D8J9D7_HALJB|nr:cupin domain-containing protein [Halalkalicoccus jeotgali]ADJ14349.1 Cupin 2 conserved barrel domain protein [Halalkalicoccus jeotgali B3]ELY40612.1 Cupin 2 barrel domain-containing protein [Halalkalicoccus jeotgali B3]